jgi:hypothetical protein
MNPLTGWDNFYVIVGSSAGALIGLQFVVMTLIANIPVEHSTAQAGHAFATPTIVHFGAVLLLAGIITAPWESIATASVFWGLLGFIGIVYSAVVVRRMRLQSSYRPELEDWLFHALMPFVAYLALAVSSVFVRVHVRRALFADAASAMLLLFTGIHNAWDAVTYHVFVQRKKEQ